MTHSRSMANMSGKFKKARIKGAECGMFYLLQDQLKSVWLFVHNMLMVGSPGSGKTLLACSIPDILPEISIDESLDVPRIYSMVDALPPGTPLMNSPKLHVPDKEPKPSKKTTINTAVASRLIIPW